MKTNWDRYFFVESNNTKISGITFKIKNYDSTAPKSVEIYYTFKK